MVMCDTLFSCELLRVSVFDHDDVVLRRCRIFCSAYLSVFRIRKRGFYRQEGLLRLCRMSALDYCNWGTGVANSPIDYR